MDSRHGGCGLLKYPRNCSMFKSLLVFSISSPSASDNAALEEVKKAKDLEIEKYKKTLNKAKKIITENIGDKKTRAADSLEVRV